MSFVINGKTIPYGLMVGRKRIQAASVGNRFVVEGRVVGRTAYGDRYFPHLFRLYAQIPENNYYERSLWNYVCTRINYYPSPNGQDVLYAKVNNMAKRTYFFRSYDGTPAEYGIYVSQGGADTRVEFSEYNDNAVVKMLGKYSGQYYSNDCKPLSRTDYHADPLFYAHVYQYSITMGTYTYAGPFMGAFVPGFEVWFGGSFGKKHKNGDTDDGYAQVHLYVNGTEFFQFYFQHGVGYFENVAFRCEEIQQPSAGQNATVMWYSPICGSGNQRPRLFAGTYQYAHERYRNDTISVNNGITVYATDNGGRWNSPWVSILLPEYAPQFHAFIRI